MTTLGRLIICAKPYPSSPTESTSHLMCNVNPATNNHPMRPFPNQHHAGKSTWAQLELVLAFQEGTFDIEQEADSFVIAWSESIILS